eukprot:m.31080 g.31080  ORF g.31080 m.31080 type:complete len:384 (+) comp10664_c0_seq1:169-1320(+)
MGQGVTHMTVINATPHNAVLSAHVHGVDADTHEQHVLNVGAAESTLISLTRNAAGKFSVIWSINFHNGTHAEFSHNLPPETEHKTMVLTNGAVTINGNQMAVVQPGAARPNPHHAKAKKEFATPMDVPPAMLPAGRLVQLRSFKTNKFVRLTETGQLFADGPANGPNTRFIIEPSPNGFLRLRSSTHPEHWVSLKGVAGQGGGRCEFKVKTVGPSRYVFRSTDDKEGLGFISEREPKPSDKVGLGEAASFSISFADSHHLLVPGNRVRLVCKTTGKKVRINNNAMDAEGGDGPFTVFRVNPSAHGFWRFESEKFPGQFLSWKGTVGQGGPFTEFVAHPGPGPNEFHFRARDNSAALGFVQGGAVKDPATVAFGPAGIFTIVAA